MIDKTDDYGVESDSDALPTKKHLKGLEDVNQAASPSKLNSNSPFLDHDPSSTKKVIKQDRTAIDEIKRQLKHNKK